MKRKIQISDLFYKYRVIIFILGFIVLLGVILLSSNIDYLKNAYKGKNRIDFSVEKGEEVNQYKIEFGDKFVQELLIHFDCSEDKKIIISNTHENVMGKIINDEYELVIDHNLKLFGEKYNFIEKNMTITTPKDVIIEKIYINNVFTINIKLVLFVELIYLVLYILVLYNKKVIEKLYIIFAVMCLGIGSIIIISSPQVGGISWDDHDHYRNMIDALDFKKVKYSLSETIMGSPNYIFKTYDTLEEKEALAKFLNTNDSKKNYVEYEGNLIRVYTLAYLPGCLIYNLLDHTGLMFTHKINIMKFTYLLIYTVVCSIAIKKAKKFKLIFFVLALIPTALYTASNISHDVLLNCLSLLAFSSYVNMISSKKVDSNDVITFIVCLSFGTLSKAVYAVMLLLILGVKNSKFKNEKIARKIKLFSVLFAFMVLGTFVLPTLISPPNTGDLRGGLDVSVAGQIKAILSNPIGFSKMFSKNVFSNIVFDFFGYITLSNFAYYGSPINYSAYIFIVMIIILGYVNMCSEIKSNMQEKIVYTFTLLVAICFIWGSMYLGFNGVRSEIINGVQGRYFIPLLFPLLYIFATDKLEIKINKEYSAKICIILYLISYYMIIIKTYF